MENGLEGGNTTKHFDMQPQKKNNEEEIKKPIVDNEKKPVVDLEKKQPANIKETKADENKPIDTTKKNPLEPIKKVEKSEEKKPIDDSEKPKFNVTFDNQLEKPKTTEKTIPQETVNLTEQSVIEFLKKEGVNVGNISELSAKDVLSESVEKFKKFEEETGRGIKDFYNSMRDWSKESKEDTIKEFYKYQYPDSSEEDINEHLELLTVTDEEEEDLDSRTLKERKLKFNETYSKALSFMSKKSKEFSTPDNKAQTQKPQTAEEIAKAHEPYWKKRDESLDKLQEVKFSIEGLGDIVLPISDDDKALVSKHTNTQEAFFERWTDEKGALNTDKSSLDVLWSIPEIRQPMLSNLMEQLNALVLDKFSKENRNVDLSRHKQKPEVEQNGASLEVFGNGKTEEENKAGTPLF